MIYTLISLLFIAFILELLGNKGKNIFLFVSMIFIVFLEAFRKESGTDYWNYYGHYSVIQEYTERFKDRQEPLYSAIALMFSKLGATFQIFSFFYFSVIYTLYYFSLRKISNFYVTAFLLLISITLGYFGSNRQLMACAILLFYTVYFHKQKFIWGLYIILAAAFHYSAIVFFPLLLMRQKFSNKLMLLSFIFVIILSFTGINHKILVFLFENLPLKKNYYAYINEIVKLDDFKSFLSVIFGCVRRTLPLFLLLKFQPAFKEKNIYNILVNIHFISLFIYIASINTVAVFNARLSLYFIIFEAITYSWFLAYMFKEKSSYRWYTAIGILLVSVFFMYKGVSNYSHLFFPYKTTFGNF